MIAPPGHHLLVEGQRLRLDWGPKENGSRPAIDPLFRSAARDFEFRVIGILLSGANDDGAAGLEAIKRHGGSTIVQDPQEARFLRMPRTAVQRGAADLVLSLAEISPALLEFLAGCEIGIE